MRRIPQSVVTERDETPAHSISLSLLHLMRVERSNTRASRRNPRAPLRAPPPGTNPLTARSEPVVGLDPLRAPGGGARVDGHAMCPPGASQEAGAIWLPARDGQPVPPPPAHACPVRPRPPPRARSILPVRSCPAQRLPARCGRAGGSDPTELCSFSCPQRPSTGAERIAIVGAVPASAADGNSVAARARCALSGWARRGGYSALEAKRSRGQPAVGAPGASEVALGTLLRSGGKQDESSAARATAGLPEPLLRLQPASRALQDAPQPPKPPDGVLPCAYRLLRQELGHPPTQWLRRPAPQ